MAVTIEHIYKSFGAQHVLNDVTLSIPEGQVLGLLGPNGAGKSTLMKILIGLWKPDKPMTNDQSPITNHQSPITNHQSPILEVPSRIGYLPENNPLYEEMYVTEYLQFMSELTNNQSPMTNIDALIDRVGLTPEKHKHIRELSKGYRQRVGLAQALLGNPQLLILDEPTTGLDPNQLVEIRALIRNLAKSPMTNHQSPMTIILSTHIMQEVREMCDRVVILDHGQIKADELINEIKDLEALFHESTITNHQ